MHRFLTFGAHPPPWDGDWLQVVLLAPELRPGVTARGPQALSALGFVRLYDSVWIRPDRDAAPVNEALREMLDHVQGARWSVLHVRFDDEARATRSGLRLRPDRPRLRVPSFVTSTTRAAGSRTRRGVGAARALVARTSAMDAWRRFALIDPDLPPHLLPEPWPRQEARELFLEIHWTLGPLAQARLVEVMAPHWPDASSWVTHFVAADDPSRAAPARNRLAAAGGRRGTSRHFSLRRTVTAHRSTTAHP